MEPQQGYYGSGLDGGTSQKKKSGSGCTKWIIIILLVILVVGGVGGYFIYLGIKKAKDFVENPNDFFTNKQMKDLPKGDGRFTGFFEDMTVIPQSDGTFKLWLVSDASINYIQTRKSPGRYSTGSACVDCKTISYLYDPTGNKVIKETPKAFDDVITETNVALINGKIYQFTHPYSKNQATINIYDPATGELVGGTSDFIAAHPELSSGIVDLSFRQDYQEVHFDTKDGQTNLTYSLLTDKIYKNQDEILKELAEKEDEGDGYIAQLMSRTNDKRKSLFRITASKKNVLIKGSNYRSYYNNERYFKEFYKEASVEVLGEKTYLDGKIYYQDNDYCIIVYVDQAGKTANRLVSCIDMKAGKEIWTLQPADIFTVMKIDENNGASTSERRIVFKRFGKTITLQFESVGVMGFDAETGKKNWEIYLHR